MRNHVTTIPRHYVHHEMTEAEKKEHLRDLVNAQLRDRRSFWAGKYVATAEERFQAALTTDQNIRLFIQDNLSQ